MRLYLRAISYFRQDLPLVVLLLVIIFASSGLGLLMAWPMAILVDSVLTATPNQDDFIHRLFLSPLPQGRLGRLIGLAAVALLLKLTQDVLAASPGRNVSSRCSTATRSSPTRPGPCRCHSARGCWNSRTSSSATTGARAQATDQCSATSR